MPIASPESSHLTASDRPRPVPPTGHRRLTAELLCGTACASSFTGLPPGVTSPGQLLAAFKAAAPSLGLKPRLVHATDWLFRFTRVGDWKVPCRPIVWPSARLQQEELGLSCTRVKAQNRELAEKGLVVMRDSPTGKRYGRRDAGGRLIEAYGFDLSLLAVRFAEFQEIAAKDKELRSEMGRLRRRATIARRGIRQLRALAEENALPTENWLFLSDEAAALEPKLRLVVRPEALTPAVEELEHLQQQLHGRVSAHAVLAGEQARPSGSVAPEEPENGPHDYSYKVDDNPDGTVAAGKRDIHNPVSPGGLLASVRLRGTKGGERILGVKPEELISLIRALKIFVSSTAPRWPDLVVAAAGLASHLQIPQNVWGEACIVMGRTEAAIAVAITAAKDPNHFTASPVAYSRSLIARASRGELQLQQTLWRLREEQGPRAGLFRPPYVVATTTAASRPQMRKHPASNSLSESAVVAAHLARQLRWRG